MDITSFLNRVNQYILNPLIVLLFVVALLVFFWGLVEFIYKAGSDEGRQTGRRNMMWGIVGMFIMIAVFGIIHLILNTFGITVPSNVAPYLNR